MNKRFNELRERLVASGRPADHFSCSELHELYDGIQELEEQNREAVNELGNCLCDIESAFYADGTTRENILSKSKDYVRNYLNLIKEK